LKRSGAAPATEIAMRVEQHQKGEGDFRTTLESLISLASRAFELFERSKPEQKRQLLVFVFSNLRLRGKKLEFSLRSPFDLMVNRASYSSWLAFLNTVRTERFEEVLALRQLFAQHSGCCVDAPIFPLHMLASDRARPKRNPA
jgi:hypothetical protein